MSAYVEKYKGYYVELDESGTFEARRIVAEKVKADEMEPMPEGAGRGVTPTGSNLTTYMESDPVAQSETLGGLKNALDRFSKATFGQTVLREAQPWELGHITSLRERHDIYSYRDVHRHYRVTFGKHWEDKQAQAIIKDTPENRVRLERMAALRAQASHLRQEEEQVRETLENYTDEELAGPSAKEE